MLFSIYQRSLYDCRRGRRPIHHPSNHRSQQTRPRFPLQHSHKPHHRPPLRLHPASLLFWCKPGHLRVCQALLPQRQSFALVPSCRSLHNLQCKQHIEHGALSQQRVMPAFPPEKPSSQVDALHVLRLGRTPDRSSWRCASPAQPSAVSPMA
jgi:hypothetical protein